MNEVKKKLQRHICSVAHYKCMETSLGLVPLCIHLLPLLQKCPPECSHALVMSYTGVEFSCQQAISSNEAFYAEGEALCVLHITSQQFLRSLERRTFRSKGESPVHRRPRYSDPSSHQVAGQQTWKATSWGRAHDLNPVAASPSFWHKIGGQSA